MSATGRGGTRDRLDRYYTPQPLADWIVSRLPERRADGEPIRRILEPSVGGGAFVRACRERWPDAEIHGIDPDPDAAGLALCDRSWLTTYEEWPAGPAYDLIIGNPPYRHAQAHIDDSFDRAGCYGHIAFLLRLALLEGKQRNAFWTDGAMPHAVTVLSERPSFTGGGTDAAAYAVFEWVSGDYVDDCVLNVASWKGEP